LTRPNPSGAWLATVDQCLFMVYCLSAGNQSFL